MSADAIPANVIKETKSDDIIIFLANIISPKNFVNLGLQQPKSINSK